MTDTMQGQSGAAAEAARTVGTTAKERASEVSSTASEEARAVAGDAKEQAREVIHRSRDELRTQASLQTDRLATTLRDVGDQLRAMSRGETQPNSQVASLTAQLADGVSNTAGRLSDGGYEGALDSVKRFARNRPGMFLLGALGAGFVVGRVVKAVDTGSIMEAAKGDQSPDTDYAAGTGALSASSSFDPQSFDPEPPHGEVTSTLPPPPTAMPSGIPPEVS